MEIERRLGNVVGTGGFRCEVRIEGSQDANGFRKKLAAPEAGNAGGLHNRGRRQWRPSFGEALDPKSMISNDSGSERAAHDLNGTLGSPGLTGDEHWPDGFLSGARPHSPLGVSAYIWGLQFGDAA